MATILQKPGNIALSGNIKDIIISTAIDVDFEIKEKISGTVILNEAYSPDDNDKITIRLRDLLPSQLGLILPDADVFEQTKGIKEYTFTVDDSTFNTVVVLGGVNANTDPELFLKANWLTWQPQQKNVKFNDPEWLSYYTITTSVVKLKAYFTNKDPEIITLTSLTEGKLYSLNVNYGYLSGKFEGQPVYFDIWTESTNGTQFSFIQRYVLFEDYFEHEDLFVAVNSVGGLDTFRFTGEQEEIKDFDIESALFDEDTIDYEIEFEKTAKKNTGYFPDARNRIWAQEFFNSLKRYYCASSGFKQITISKVTAKSKENDISTHSYDFTYGLSYQTKYLNLSRTNELPDTVEIVDPNSELFFLAPRLIEFPTAEIDDSLLFPVQVPFAETWNKLSFGEIRKAIVDSIGNIDIDLTGYATQQWVIDKNYLTEHQSLEGYATEQWVNSQNFVTNESISDYATQQWVIEQGYSGSPDLSAYAKKEDVHDKEQKFLLNNLSVQSGYIKFENEDLSVGNADKLEGIKAENYARTDIEETFNESVRFDSSAKFNKHVFYSSDTDEDVITLRRYGKNHTLLNMMAPPQASWGIAHECTLALVRGNNNEYFMDIYNMDYGHDDQGNYMDFGDARMGIRLQKRGSGHYTPFNIEYGNGSDEYSAIKILPNGTDSSNKTSVEVNRLLANYDEVRRFETTDFGTLTNGDSLISGFIGNTNFVSGFAGKGWRIEESGVAEFDELNVRKGLRINELFINKIRSGNGSFWFSDGSKISRLSSEDDTGYTVELDSELGNPFQTGQKIRCQVFNGSGVKFYEATISWAGNSTYPNLIKLDKAGYVGDAPEVGDEIVRVSGGAVYVTSIDSGSPYLDVVYDMNVKARLGKLTGINDADFGGNLTGYGLYSDNVYLKGIMKLSAGSSISFEDVIGGQDAIDSVQTDADTAIVNAGLAQTKANSAYSLADTKITSSQATTITQNTVTAAYINALELKSTKGEIGGLEISNHRLSTEGTSWGSEDPGFWISSSERELMLYKSTSEYLKMFYTNDSDWGIYAKANGHSVFKLGSENTIAGWDFDNRYLYTGTKQTSDDYSTDGITLHGGSSPAIRATQFRIDEDGSAHFKGELDAPEGTIGGFVIDSDSLESSDGKMKLTSTAGTTSIILETSYVDEQGYTKQSKAIIDNEGLSFHGSGRVQDSVVKFDNIGACGLQAYAEDDRGGLTNIVTGLYGRASNRDSSGSAYGVFCDGTLWTRNIETYTYSNDISNTDSSPLYLDIDSYGYFSLNPTIGDAYIRIPSNSTDEAREITIFNRNDDRKIHVRWSLIHSDNFVIDGGCCLTLISDKREKYQGNSATTRKRGWVVKSYFDNNF